jgi:fucokinase
MVSASSPEPGLASLTRRSRQIYARLLAGDAFPWWTDVIITASSDRQAERYCQEIERRRAQGAVPPVPFHVVPDPDGHRIGSGGATLNALQHLGATARSPEWWAGRRVLMLHSGGDSRRLPEYSPLGKLFTSLPVTTLWGGVSTVFDEILALSTTWAENTPSGLVVGSGDVVLTFDGAELNWTRPGVTGAAMRQPAAVGRGHGVYVIGDRDRVYTFLQKPSPEETAAAGGVLPDGQVALDIGLLRFDPDLSAALTALGSYLKQPHPEVDLYTHFAFALTGAWHPSPSDHPVHHGIAALLRGRPGRAPSCGRSRSGRRCRRRRSGSSST